MVLRARFPAIVRGFMIVPNGDERHGCCCGLQRRIRSILRMAFTVIIEANNLMFRIMNAVLKARRFQRPIFIIIIAKMYYGVIGFFICAFRNCVIGIEIAMLPICAGRDGEMKLWRVAIRKCSGAANRGHGVASAKLVEVILSRAKSFGNDFNCVIARRICDGGARGNGSLERGVLKHVPSDLQISIGLC